MYPLNIQLQSIEFFNGIVQESDSIRVSLTTFPDEQKLNTSVEVKNLKTDFPCFTVNISDKTEKILLVFRKKYLVQRDPIIASTVITFNDFPKLTHNSTNNVVKTFDLLEPRKKMANKQNSEATRKIVGRAEVKLELLDEIQIMNELIVERKNVKKHSGQEYSKINMNFENCVEYHYQ